MMKYTIYIIYNLLYQLGAFFFFLYSNTYLNEAFVPESLMWNKNQPRTDRAGLGGVVVIKTSVLVVEAAILILVIFFINKAILRGFKGAYTPNIIANRTAKINIALSLCFIAILVWGSFRGFLW